MSLLFCNYVVVYPLPRLKLKRKPYESQNFSLEVFSFILQNPHHPESCNSWGLQSILNPHVTKTVQKHFTFSSQNWLYVYPVISFKISRLHIPLLGYHSLPIHPECQISLIHSRMSCIIPLVQLISSKPLHFKLTKLTTHKERCHLIEFSWLKLFECLICCTTPLHLLLSIINKMFTLKIIWKRHSNCIKIPCCWLLT